VAIRPGHPVVLGVAHGKPFLGIPGYPVSAVLTSELFLQPLLARLLGVPLPERSTLTATMTRKVLSPMGEDEFLRVKLGRVGDRLVATPLQRGAGVLMSLVRADGIVRIPRFSEGVHAGAPVEVALLRSPREVERTVVAIGSHDLTLDLLSDLLARRAPGWSLSSSNVGSQGGLIALQRGECHLAGTHLLDEESGEYNVSYVRRYLRDRPIVLMTLVYRDQGLLVPRGNPKRIRSLEDLARPDVQYVNRQRGAGTRVLLDYKLAQLGIDPSAITGYDREEYTHLGVAAAVAGGSADTGLGILAAARALGLDFVPLLQERYDLAIPRELYDSALLAPLLDIIRGPEFRAIVESLGGYDTSDTGRIVAEL
jgi:putative molybdopterin biosynthesis protein